MSDVSRKTLTVIGDSLSMPRPIDNIYAIDLYSSKLMLSGRYVVFNRATRANTTETQCLKQNIKEDITGTNSDIYVIQLGVCDCYPRIFTKLQHMILMKLPDNIKEKIIGFRSRNRYELTRSRPYFNVRLPDFERAYRKIMDEIECLPGQPRQVILINIGYPSRYNIERNYNLVDIIESYNAVIEKLSIERHCYLIDFNTASKNEPALMLEDGIHITKAGHQYFHDQICHGLDVLSAHQPECETGHVIAEK